MPLNREWQSRIKAVEREHTAIGQAAVYFHQAALKNPGILQQGLRPREILAASKSLEGTYIIRLFAEFETGARQFWHTCRRTKPPTEILLNRLAAKCAIPSLQLESAHIVRDYRNDLVHERESTPVPLSIGDARSFLCRFFSFLPPEW